MAPCFMSAVLKIAYQIGPSEGVQRDGNEAGPTLYSRSAGTGLKSGLQYVGEKISASLDPLRNGWLASELQQTPTHSCHLSPTDT